LTVVLWLWNEGDEDTTGKQREGRKEVREEDMKEVLIKLYRTSLDTSLLIIYQQPHVSAL